MTNKTLPTLNDLIDYDNEDEKSITKSIESLLVENEGEEKSILQKIEIFGKIISVVAGREGAIQSLLTENAEFIENLVLANEKMAGMEIQESDFFFSKHLVDNNAALIHLLQKSVADEEEIESITTLIKEWSDFSGKVLSGFEKLLNRIEEIQQVSDRIKSLKSDLAETDYDENEDIEKQFEGMFKLSGKQFKNILKNSVVDSISGYILNVTDKNLQVKAYQPLELNHLNKIRPPVSVIKDDTVLFIDEMSFYNENTGRAFDESDLETIIAFM